MSNRRQFMIQVSLGSGVLVDQLPQQSAILEVVE